MILKFNFVYFILKLIPSNKVKTIQLGWRLWDYILSYFSSFICII